MGLGCCALSHLRALENIQGAFSVVATTWGLSGHILSQGGDTRHMAMSRTVQHNDGSSCPQGQ